MSIPNERFADEIVVLDSLEAVRRRPGMYIGNVHDGSGLEHMLFEVVSNAIDEHLAGRARHLSVDVDVNGTIVVEDDGCGISVDPWRGGRTFLEIVLAVLHGGATFDGHHPHVHLTRSMYGVGLAPVNALSSRFDVESRRDGKNWRIAYERGVCVDPLASHGQTARTGTRVSFRPDRAIFAKCPTLDPSRIEARLRELAWLNPLLTLRWQGEELPGRGGVAAWAHELAGEIAGHVIEVHRVIDDVAIDLAIAWRASGTGSPTIRSFVSQSPTVDGGAHVDGFYEGLFRGLAPLAPDASREVLRDLFLPGLCAVVNVGLEHPRFYGPTRDRLQNPEAAAITQRVVEEVMRALVGRGSRIEDALRARPVA